MTVYCVKKICEYNSACCVKAEGEVFTCTKEDILINSEVECDAFTAKYSKLENCMKCAKKSRVITLNNCENKYANIKVNINQSSIKDFRDVFDNNTNNNK